MCLELLIPYVTVKGLTISKFVDFTQKSKGVHANFENLGAIYKNTNIL